LRRVYVLKIADVQVDMHSSFEILKRTLRWSSSWSMSWIAIASLLLGLIVVGACSKRVDQPQARPKSAATGALQLETAAWELPEQVPDRGFLSSQACQRCHEKSHESWHRSFHRTMTQVAGQESIQAPFDGRELTRNGVTCTVKRRGDEFLVIVPDPDVEYRKFQARSTESAPPPQMVERPVVLVTGSHHMQIYWLPSHNANELRIFPWVYFIDEQRWIPYEDSFLVPPSVELMRANWNANCIACHSLEGKPNHNFATKRFKTEVVEFGISCEACHGPGQTHIQWHDDKRPEAEKGADPIVHPGHVPTKVASQICGQCHSDFIRDQSYYVSGPQYRAGGNLNAAQKSIDFEARKDPRHPFHDSHWEDGTSRVGGREYTGMIASACFQKGELTCITCHSMHGADPNQQLTKLAQGNGVCLQCHQTISNDITAHTHHAADSSGSECYNCHMPRTSVALFRAMRSHRVDSPNAITSQTSGRPNACNLCHLDKSLAWTAERMHDWYGAPLPEAESANVAGGPADVAASVEWLLKGDAAQRIVAAWHLGWKPAQQASGNHWEAPLLAQLLNDPYSAVRLVAGRSLKTLPLMTDMKFDFLEPYGERQKSKSNAIELWNGSPREPALDPAAVLQQPNGQLDEAAVRRMLQLQNRRAVTITE
jgi:predicted CXXCH cytochrome family protein